MSRASVVVVGAGVFGASLAYELAGRGWEVTLVDQCPPGHARAASGDESRLIRYAHGDQAWYTRSAWRAREGWRALEEETGERLMEETGGAWFAHREDGWEADSQATLATEGIPAERLSPDAAADLFPDLGRDDLSWVLWEPNAGILHARRATQALARQARARGATFVGREARPDGSAAVVDGRRLEADRVVWACGAWLPRLFPGLVDLRVTKQDVLYFGVPNGWESPPVPVWVDYDHAAYGHGDVDARGFKCAPDLEGPEFDPQDGARVLTPEHERAGRSYISRRFPALADAPLVGYRACQYEITADTHFLLAAHPGQDGVWLMGGGSGHGFKHGPALGAYAADVISGERAPDPMFRLGRRDPGRALRTAGGSRRADSTEASG